MQYHITHTTTYRYQDKVPIGYSRVCVTPRACPHQQCAKHYVEVEPAPVVLNHETLDYYGNIISFYCVQEPHDALTIRGVSEVTIEPQLTPTPEATTPWEQVRDQIRAEAGRAPQDPYQFAVSMELSDDTLALRELAEDSFAPATPILVGAMNLMNRIYSDFTYDTTATTVTTPLNDVLGHRRGVCQDFAHVQIGCLRALGLAARYVSGYIAPIRGDSPEENIGAYASHAWVSVFVPGHGWVDIDPTNNCLPTDEHITVAWGREFVDVSPVRGVVIGGGLQQLTVGVDVDRVA